MDVISFHTPTFPLSEFVQCFWCVIGRTPYLRDKILPSTTIELMFNLGSPHKVVDKDDFDKFHLHKESWVAGFQTGYIVTEAMAETNIMGIRFKPGGAYPFCDFPISELSNQVIDMDLIWGNLIDKIRFQLFEYHTLAERFQLMEQIMLNRLRPDIYGWDSIQQAIHEITRSDTCLTIKTLSHQIGMSQKHLIGQFKKIVGVSPKQFQRVVKFNQMLRTIDPFQPIDWTEVAHQCNYYDQSHFNKDFASFSGLTPSVYIQLRNEFFTPDLLGEDSVNFVPIQ